MRFSYADTDLINYMRFTNIANFVSGTSNIVWGCGDKPASTFVVGSLTFSRSSEGSSNPSSGWIGTTSSSMNCRGIGKVTLTQAYVLASSSSEQSLIKVNVVGTTRKMTKYDFQSAFASSNINYGIFDSSGTNAWIVGDATAFGGGLSKSFTK